MIKPHGGDILKPLFVEDSEERNRLIEESASLPDLLLNSAAAAELRTKSGNDTDSSISVLRSSKFSTNNGFNISPPCGLIIPCSF